MEKESYSIDDILSDLKKHKEMEEAADKSNQTDKTSNDNENLTLKEENISDKGADENINAPVDETAAPDEEFVLETVDEEKDIVETEPETETENEPEPETETQITSDEEQSDTPAQEEYVDLMAMSVVEEQSEDQQSNITEQDTKSQKKKKTTDPEKLAKRKKRLRLLKFFILILVIAIIGVGTYAYLEVRSWADSISNNSGENSDYIQTQWEGMDNLVENFPEIQETEADNLSSLQDMIKTWYYNGAPCSSSHVLNVLLIGEDTRGDEILEDETRADAAIIASVNTDTKTITLTSVLRDAYAYWEDEPGNLDSGQFGKINGAMATGGIDGYINCVERLYKIDIDNYAIVNFDSFESIIDELGGVELEITSSEINEINNHPDTYGYVTIDQTFDGDSGYMTLTGEQALAYCRIRHIDSDNARADRQKYCLSQLFDQAADASATTQLKIIKTLIPYLHTGFTSEQVLSMANYAVKNNWLSYSMQTITVPNARIKERGAGGQYYGAWCWKADYPQDANFLQTILYGKSSITLAQNRVDVLNCNLYGFFEESYVPCYATIYNESYGVATTYELTTEEETTY